MAGVMPDRERQGWSLLGAGALLWFLFHTLGRAYGNWALGLGSIQEPGPRHLLFLVYFTFFGSLGAGLLAAGALRAFHQDAWWSGWEDRWFLPRAVGLGLLIPVALRVLVLGGAPIADDESLYRFGAELLLQGRVAAESHPMRLFFDHAFLVNDGRMYSQYFLGWPALLSVGVAVGLGGFVNAVLSALTVPPLYLLVKDLTDRMWAQVVTGLFLLSPMLQLLAATELSHTSALLALTWTAWLAFRAVRAPASAWPAGLLGLAFSVAFFIRPLTALGIGLPFLVLWGVAWWRGGRRPGPAAAFLGPSVALAALFLLVNRLQTGSALEPAYMAWQDYARANAFRFSGLNPDTAPEVPNLAFQGAEMAVRTAALGLIRLGYALLGWPLAFLFLPLAVGARRSWPLWGSLGLFLVLHLPLRDVGIDTVGPVHFTELALPVLLLTGVGLHRLAGWLDRRMAWNPEGGAGPQGAPAEDDAGPVGTGAPAGDDGPDTPPDRGAEGGRRVVLAAVLALVLCNVVLYAPARLRAVSVVGALVGVPRATLERARLDDAVVFSSVPWALGCNPAVEIPSRPFVFWWPMNEPGLTDDVIHANHLSTARDRALMEAYFPDRSGWILNWRQDCTLDLVPLDDPAAEEVPNGIMLSGTRGVLRYDPSHPPTGAVPPGFSP